jgi:hypothetical protein
MNKLPGIPLVAALCMLAVPPAQALEQHSDAAITKLQAVRETLSKWDGAERKADDGWMGAAQRSISTAVWVIMRGRQLNKKLGATSFDFEKETYRLPGVSATYQPKNAVLASLLTELKAAHDELDQSTFSGKTYGYFQIAKGAMAAAEDAIRRAAIHIDKLEKAKAEPAKK